jgi:hypothetical protein
MTIQPITIRLNTSMSGKVQLIQRAMSEPISELKIIEGLIDVGYANALKTLHQAGAINSHEFQQCRQRLPDYPQRCLN